VSDEKNFNELIEARVFLETTLAKKATKKRKESDIEKLKKNLDESKQAYNDPVQFARLDSQFHQFIANIADNKFLWRMQQLLHGAVDEFISENVKSDESRIDAIKDHEQIIKDIINQDEDNIEKTVPNHIYICVKHFREKKEADKLSSASMEMN
jgi:DNA-binding FadR family transcriptional regulator